LYVLWLNTILIEQHSVVRYIIIGVSDQVTQLSILEGDDLLPCGMRMTQKWIHRFESI